MRKIGLALSASVLVVLVGATILIATFDVNKYRGALQNELRKGLGRPVKLGDMHLKLFPPRFGVEDLVIFDDPQFNPYAPFIKAKELDVSVKFLPFLHKQIEIGSLSLERPRINLIKNQAGIWNFASMFHRPNVSTGSEKSGQMGEQQFSIRELTIRDGQISLMDQAQSKTPSLYHHIDVTLKNFALNSPFSVEATVHTGSGTLTLQAQGGPLAEQDLSRTPFHGTLDIKQVGVAAFTKFISSAPMNGTDGNIDAQLHLSNDSGKLTARGEISIQNVKVNGIEIGYPVSAQYDITDDLSSDILAIRKLLVKLGPLPFQITGTVDSKPSPVRININLRAVDLSIADAARFPAALGMAPSQGTIVTGVANATIQARGAVDKPALSGTVNATDIQVSGKGIAEPLKMKSVNVNLSASEISSSPFNVVSGATTVEAQFTMRNYLSPAPTIEATVRAPNAQLSAILALAKAYGITSLDKVSGEGTINLDMRASGPVKSINDAEIERTLSGTINLNLANVKYSAANIGRELASLGGFLNQGSNAQDTSGMTKISKMTGNIAVKNGVAQTDDLQAQLDLGNFGLVGTANLATESLNMRATAVISQAVSQKVGGQNIAGFMKTVLANNQGELVIPAVVTGTFSNPKFEPDLQQVAKMKLKGLIPNTNNSASLAGAFQNLLGAPKHETEASQPQSQQSDPVQQIVGLFGKKKQNEQQK